MDMELLFGLWNGMEWNCRIFQFAAFLKFQNFVEWNGMEFKIFSLHTPNPDTYNKCQTFLKRLLFLQLNLCLASLHLSSKFL